MWLCNFRVEVDEITKLEIYDQHYGVLRSVSFQTLSSEVYLNFLTCLLMCSSLSICK